MKIICHEKGLEVQRSGSGEDANQHRAHERPCTAVVPDAVPWSRQVLESGTPTTRNKMGGHGMGVQTRVVPSYMAAYALQTAAANITLMVSAFEAARNVLQRHTDHSPARVCERTRRERAAVCSQLGGSQLLLGHRTRAQNYTTQWSSEVAPNGASGAGPSADR